MQLQGNSSFQQEPEDAKNDSQSVSIEELSLQSDFVASTDTRNTPARSRKYAFDLTLPLEILKFVAPLTISVALLVLTYKQVETAKDDQRQKAMSDYFEQMTELKLEEKKFGGKFEENDQAKLFARAKTLNTLRQLDGPRKGQVLKFLYEANLIGVCKTEDVSDKELNFQKIEPCMGSILDLREAKLDGTTFDLRGIALDGIDLEGASLTKADIPNIGLFGAEMESAKLDGANLKGAFLREAKMPNVNLIDAQLTDAILVKAVLTGAFLRRADLRGAILEEANLQDAEIIEGKLDNSNLQRANLLNADLQNASLQEANLQEADLRDADLRGAALQGANLQGAKYNNRTEFGDFNPEARGMILQD